MPPPVDTIWKPGSALEQSAPSVDERGITIPSPEISQALNSPIQPDGNRPNDSGTPRHKPGERAIVQYPCLRHRSTWDPLLSFQALFPGPSCEARPNGDGDGVSFIQLSLDIGPTLSIAMAAGNDLEGQFNHAEQAIIGDRLKIQHHPLIAFIIVINCHQTHILRSSQTRSGLDSA
jgi:hypothetical protein